MQSRQFNNLFPILPFSHVCLLFLQAPFTPFITEMMYQNLRHLIDPASIEEKDTNSIHYLMLPQVRLEQKQSEMHQTEV